MGDNLALNINLGFGQSCSSKYACRICDAPKNVIQSLTTEDIKYLRTSANYEDDCTHKRKGLSEKCTFHKIPHYNVFEQAVLDPMHDLNEGVCRYDLGFILNMFIYKEKRFSLDFLNTRISALICTDDSNSVPTLFVSRNSQLLDLEKLYSF